MVVGRTIEKIAGTVLAGGRGRRLGGNKPMHFFQGRPLIEHVIGRLDDQVDALWLSAGANCGDLVRLGRPIITDAPQYADHGPIAGIEASLTHAASNGFNYVAIVPCDAPFLMPELIAELSRSLRRSEAPAIIASTSRGIQPAFGLWSVEGVGTARAALNAGRWDLHSLCEQLQVAVWECRANGYSEEPFLNINSSADIAEAEDLYATA